MILSEKSATFRDHALTILSTVEYAGDDHQIRVLANLIDENVRQPRYHPLIRTRRPSRVTHKGKAAEPFGAFEDPLDDSIG
jgi:hypothetical protein